MIDLSVSQYWDKALIPKIEKEYNCKFVCESSIKVGNSWRHSSSLIFYSEEKHPEGSNYMAFSYSYEKDAYVVSDGISVAEVDIYGQVAANGDIIYSRFRHDYRFSADKSVWIDGGRDYTRSGCGPGVTLRIIDGELKVTEEVKSEIEPINLLDLPEERPVVKYSRANGTKGCLLQLMTDPPQYVFRVYDEEYGFIDYNIRHYDVDMVIDDDSAAFYEIDGEHYIDYTPESLAYYGT